MDIVNKVKQRKRGVKVTKNNVHMGRNSVNNRNLKAGTKHKHAASPRKKSSPHLKSLSKARQISTRRNNTTGNKRGRISRLLLSKAKKSSPDKNSVDQTTPPKPAFYRTRNAATAAYEEKLEAVRAARLDLKKLTKTCAKKDLNTEAGDYVPTTPKYETINESRVLACGLWFKVGDIVSVVGDERAHFKTYYARILLFLKDRYGEHYCEIRWLIPLQSKNLNKSDTTGSNGIFDIRQYVEGPGHTEPIKISNINFVAHAPQGPGILKPGFIGNVFTSMPINQYRCANENRILDVPTRTATTTDPRLRNPYL